VVVAVVGVILVVAIAAAAIGVAALGGSVSRGRSNPSPTTGPVTATTALRESRGSVVFTDDFHDPSSGWTTDTLPSGTTFHYSNGHYVIVAHGDLDHHADSPYSNPVNQISSTVTATQSTGAPSGAGFGATCLRGSGAAAGAAGAGADAVRYEFVVLVGGKWLVSRRDGITSTSAGPTTLKEGSSVASPGTAALTVTAMCATLGDGQSTRLALYVAGSKVADLTDRPKAGLPTDGWYGGLVVSSSGTGPSTVTVTHFASRDLAS
jgi:hypothetical protein